MLHIGQYQTLKLVREKPQGYYLECSDGKEVLMPRKYHTEDMKIGDDVEVFVYCDHKDKEIATTETPKITVGQFGLLEVADVNKVGAFCDWGVTKQLIIPYRNQLRELKVGDKVVVYMYLDQKTDRLVGSTKLRPFLIHQAGPEIMVGQEVSLMVYAKIAIGYKVVIDQKYAGLVYSSELNYSLDMGQRTKGYIKVIREDRLIDVTLYKKSENLFEESRENIMMLLDANEGFLPFTDKTSPDVIRRQFGISKKRFKKIVGNLYRQREILIKDDGIYINEGSKTFDTPNPYPQKDAPRRKFSKKDAPRATKDAPTPNRDFPRKRN